MQRRIARHPLQQAPAHRIGAGDIALAQRRQRRFERCRLARLLPHGSHSRQGGHPSRISAISA